MQIGVPTACFAPMQAALKLGAAKKYGGLNSYAQAFAKNAKAAGTQVESVLTALQANAVALLGIDRLHLRRALIPLLCVCDRPVFVGCRLPG